MSGFALYNLHRVTSRTVTQAFALTGNLGMTESYGYDANGNISSKTGVGHYQYNVSDKPNRLASVWQYANFSGTRRYNFSYDANGNITNDGKRTFAYTAFDLPSLVTQGLDTTSFSYGPNRELVKRIDARSSGTTTTLMIDNLYQQISLPSGVIEHKFMVGNAVVTRRTGEGGNDVFYLYKDQQGSTTMVTNYLGTVVQQLLYDPWGRQYQVSANVLKYSNNALTKGYTGHDMVNDFEVIHMGGRTYNPVLGRFMQADPFIQQASNLQSFNRYAYVLNNPMSYTDPSGCFFKKLFNFVKENWRSLTSIAVGYLTFGLGTGVWNLAQLGSLGFGTAVGWGAIAGATSGLVASGSLRGALTGAISGAAFGALGGLGLNGMENFAASGLLGGALTDIQGGKFGHGFVSAGIGAVAGGKFGSNPYAQVIGSAIVGGTVSAITGGKFANGAVGAAFAAALQADWGGRDEAYGGSAISDNGFAKDNSGQIIYSDETDGSFCEAGVTCRVSDDFRAIRGKGFHSGIDIQPVKDGKVLVDANVLSVTDGTVLYLGGTGFGSDAVIIKTPDGNHVIYGHMRNKTVTKGQKITKGQVLGNFGNKGSVSPIPKSATDLRTGLHLHFEIRQGSIPYKGLRLGYRKGW